MKVLFLPKASNPYQYLLADALTKLGVLIEHHSSLPPIAWLFRNRGWFQVVHIHWPDVLYRWEKKTPIRFLRFVFWIMVARIFGLKVIWTAHNIMPHKRASPVIDLLARYSIVILANSIIVHCEYARKELGRRFFRKRNVFVIPHGNYSSRFPKAISKNLARRKMNLRDDAFVFLFFGKLLPYKGIESILREFRNLEDPNAILLVAGQCKDQPLKKTVRESAQHDDRIQLLLEYIPDEMVAQIFGVADVFITSFNEILTSGSIILGLSFGLPVIAPKLGCLPELVSDDVGILYSPSEGGALLSAMQMIQSRDLEKMNQQAKILARSLDWQMIAKDTNKVYQT